MWLVKAKLHLHKFWVWSTAINVGFCRELFSWMEPITTYRSRRSSSYGRLVAITLTLIAVFSPLYIDRMPERDLELEEQPINFASWLPLLLLVLILAITLSLYFDQSFSRFDPYWIHRVGGSSGGIIAILIILALVLKCKAWTTEMLGWNLKRKMI